MGEQMQTTTNLVGEAEADAEQEPTEDEHVDVDGGPADRRACDEGGTAEEHRGAAAGSASYPRGEQGGDEAGDV